MTPEARFRRHVLRWLTDHGHCAFAGAGRVGAPDILVCVAGQFVGIELKAERGRTSKVQRIMHKRLVAAGGIVAVVRTIDELRRVVRRAELRGGRDDRIRDRLRTGSDCD